MAEFENRYAQRIYEIISPYLGDMMAKGAIRTQCKKIGVSEDAIEQKDIISISDNIKKAMVMFVGSENAVILANRIKRI
jgi:hypothetical protein